MDSAKRGKAHAQSSGLLSASDVRACKSDNYVQRREMRVKE